MAIQKTPHGIQPLRFNTDEKELLDTVAKIAKREKRSMSSQIKYILEKWLVEKGYMKDPPFLP